MKIKRAYTPKPIAVANAPLIHLATLGHTFWSPTAVTTLCKTSVSGTAYKKTIMLWNHPTACKACLKALASQPGQQVQPIMVQNE